MPPNLASEILAFNNDKHVLGSAPHTLKLEFIPAARRHHPATPRLHLVEAGAKKTRIQYGAVFLNFEHITGKGQPPEYEVYLNSCADSITDDHYAGALPPQGAATILRPGIETAGGQCVVLDITELYNRLHAQPGFDESKLQICLQPCRALAKDAQLRIGRITLYAQ